MTRKLAGIAVAQGQELRLRPALADHVPTVAAMAEQITEVYREVAASDRTRDARTEAPDEGVDYRSDEEAVPVGCHVACLARCLDSSRLGGDRRHRWRHRRVGGRRSAVCASADPAPWSSPRIEDAQR